MGAVYKGIQTSLERPVAIKILPPHLAQNSAYITRFLRESKIVASIRHPLHFVEAARMGAHISTIPPKVLGQLIKHPLTDIGLEKFLADWKKLETK